MRMASYPSLPSGRGHQLGSARLWRASSPEDPYVSSMRSLRVAVAGSSLGGLALAQGLLRADGRVGMAIGVVRVRTPPQVLELPPAPDYLMWALAGARQTCGVPVTGL